MDTAAPSRRAGPRRGRPLIPPNYVSLRDLQELRLREKEERRWRQEEEEAAAAARRAEEEERRRKEEEEEAAAARRAKEEEERRRRVEEEEEAAARRVRDAAAAVAPRPEMKGSSSSRAPFRHNDRNRGGPRVVVGPHRSPPPPRGEDSTVSSGGAAVDSRGKKGPGGDAANGTLGDGGKAWSEGKGKASAGLIAGPAEPATVSSLGGKPEQNRKGEEATGYEGTALVVSSAPGKLTKEDTASYRGKVRPNYRGNGRKGLDGRSRTTETAMAGATCEAVKALPPPAGDSENKGKNGSDNQSTGKASASPPGEAAEASPLQGAKSDNRWKKKPSGGRQAGAAPSSDWPNGSGDKPRRDDEGSRGRRSGGGQGTIWEAKSEGLGGKQTEVEGKVYSHRPTEGSSNRRSDSAKFEDFGENQLVVEMKAQPHPSADSNNYRRRSGDQGMNQEAKSEGFEEKQTDLEMRAAAQPKPCNVRNYRRQQPAIRSRLNGAARQHGSVWVPKAAAAPVHTEVGNFP